MRHHYHRDEDAVEDDDDRLRRQGRRRERPQNVDRVSDANHRLLNETSGDDFGGGAEGDQTANVARTGSAGSDRDDENVDMIMMMDSAQSPVTTGDESPPPSPTLQSSSSLKVDPSTPPPSQTIQMPVITTAATSSQVS